MEEVEQATAKAKTTRGKGFPALSLPAAVRIVKSAGQVTRNLTLGSLASYAGHSTPNSGAFKTKLAALRDWGLVSSSKGQNLILTDLAMTIALPASEDDEMRAMREAFLGFGLFNTFYRESAKNVPLVRTNMANSAVHTYQIGIQSKEAFIKSFVASAVAVGLAEPIGKDKVVLKPMSATSEIIEEIQPKDVNSGPASLPSTNVYQAPTSPVMQQAWEHANGKVHLVIESSSPLTLEVFQELPKVIASIQDLIRVLGPKEGNESVSE
ncbi:MAG: hypothetical protein ABIP74_04575 [Candidatus Saccharimonas sp.]